MIMVVSIRSFISYLSAKNLLLYQLFF